VTVETSVRCIEEYNKSHHQSKPRLESHKGDNVLKLYVVDTNCSSYTENAAWIHSRERLGLEMYPEKAMISASDHVKMPYKLKAVDHSFSYMETFRK
jgi:hypothetical protein